MDNQETALGTLRRALNQSVKASGMATGNSLEADSLGQSILNDAIRHLTGRDYIAGKHADIAFSRLCRETFEGKATGTYCLYAPQWEGND